MQNGVTDVNNEYQNLHDRIQKLEKESNRRLWGVEKGVFITAIIAALGFAGWIGALGNSVKNNKDTLDNHKKTIGELERRLDVEEKEVPPSVVNIKKQMENVKKECQHIIKETRDFVDRGEKVGIGTVMAWPLGKDTPEGWLICDGEPRSRLNFPKLNGLFENYNYPYGSGDGTTTFGIPDYRGYFLRGVDDPDGRRVAQKKQHIDPDIADREGGISNMARVGSIQMCATKNPNNPIYWILDEKKLYPIPIDMCHGNANHTYVLHGISKDNESYKDDILKGGDNETRPINIYVNWIIKAK